MGGHLRGAWQIRTAVDGFADRYLASRSRHHFFITTSILPFCGAKVHTFFLNYKHKPFFLQKNSVFCILKRRI